MIWPLIFSFSTTGRVQKNALAEASAMAKMKDDHFELVINIQKFTPEEVKVYVEGQAVLVTAKKCTSEGFVTDTFENKFNLPEDVDVSRLTSGNIVFMDNAPNYLVGCVIQKRYYLLRRVLHQSKNFRYIQRWNLDD